MGVKSMFFASLVCAGLGIFCQPVLAGTLAEMSKQVYATPGIQHISLKKETGEIFYSSLIENPESLELSLVLGKISQERQQQELARWEFESENVRLSPLVLVPGTGIIIFCANIRQSDGSWKHGLFVYAGGMLQEVFQANRLVLERNLNWMSDPAYDEYADRICFAIGGVIHLVDFDKDNPFLLLGVASRYDTGDAEIKKAPALDGKYVVFFSTTSNVHIVEKGEFPVFWKIPVSSSGISGAKILTVEGFPQGEILLSTYAKTQLVSINYLTLKENWRSNEYPGICRIPPLATAPQFSKWLASLAGKLYQFSTDGRTTKIYPSGEENFGIILWLDFYNRTEVNRNKDLLFLETDERLLNCRLWLLDDETGLAKYKLVHRETSRYVSSPATDGKLIAVPVEDFLVVFRPARRVNLAPIIDLLLGG